ncbi:hypothetical protein ACP275_07G112900 [Erythranthe tilingii]
MNILLLSISFPIILIIYLLQKYKKPVKTLVPPGPEPLPLIGNLHQIGAAKDPHIYLWQLSKKYGPLMHMKLGSIPLIVISSAKLAKQVFKTQDLAFSNRPNSLGHRKLTYNCVDIACSPYGEYWRELRKITTVHLFSLQKSQSFRPVREDEIYRTVEKISGFDSSPFGKKYDEGNGSEMRSFDELLHEAQAMFAAFFVSDYFPMFGWIDKITGLINRLDKTFENLDSFYQEIIDERLLDPTRAKKKEEDYDILDILIQLKEEKSSSIDLKWDNIKAVLTDIFIAATDTSAAATVWTMTALMKAPNNVMQKVQSEIRNSVGEKGRVDEDDLPKLPYLKAVINETFRLYPPAPLLVPRQTIERCIIEGYEIQPKTLVYINAWAIARDPDYWENPFEFLPERFLNSNIDITQFHTQLQQCQRGGSRKPFEYGDTSAAYRVTVVHGQRGDLSYGTTLR